MKTTTFNPMTISVKTTGDQLYKLITHAYLKEKQTRVSFSYRILSLFQDRKFSSPLLDKIFTQITATHKKLCAMNRCSDEQLKNDIIAITRKHGGHVPDFAGEALSQHYGIAHWRHTYRNDYGTLSMHSYGRHKEYYYEYSVSETDALQKMIKTAAHDFSQCQQGSGTEMKKMK